MSDVGSTSPISGPCQPVTASELIWDWNSRPNVPPRSVFALININVFTDLGKLNWKNLPNFLTGPHLSQRFILLSGIGNSPISFAAVNLPDRVKSAAAPVPLKMEKAAAAVTQKGSSTLLSLPTCSPSFWELELGNETVKIIVSASAIY